MNQRSNPNMPKATVETLKQIQKQGLSISIVSSDSSRSSFPLESTVSKETRAKQNVTIDKTPKLPTRSSLTAENKAIASQVRSSTSAESRSSIGQPTLTSSQSTFQDGKALVGIAKTLTPNPSSEIRASVPQNWNSPSPVTENKAQGNPTRAAQLFVTPPDVKNQGRLLPHPENKNHNVRSTQSVTQVPDGKSQTRMVQTSLLETKNQSNLGRSSLSFEGKLPTSQVRMPLGSPPLEVKVVNSSQVRLGQKNSSSVHDIKGISVQRSIPQMLNEAKSLNNQNKTPFAQAIEAKTNNELCRALKVTPLRSITKPEQSPLSERVSTNPFRIAATLGKKVAALGEEKATVKVMKVSQNVSYVAENQTALHSKVSQNLSMQESRAVSKVVKISMSDHLSVKSPNVFDNSSDSNSTVGAAPMASLRTTTPKRPQSKVVSSPIPKKKCVKRTPATTPEKVVKQQSSGAEAGSFSSDEGSPKEKKLFNMKGLTPGLTITPVTQVDFPSTSGTSTRTNDSRFCICPTCKNCSLSANVCDICKTKLPPNQQIFTLKNDPKIIPSYVVTKNVTTSIEKKIVYTFPDNAGQNSSFHIQKNVQGKLKIQGTPVKVSPRSKGRTKYKRKFEEPVCYTLSSDDEEPVSHLPFHPMLDQSQGSACHLFMESEAEKSDHSSNSEMLPEDNQDFEDAQFPGVTDINDFPEEEEEIDDEEMECEDEEVEEEEEELEEEEEEDEDVTTEEDIMHGSTRGATDYPLNCRSIRIGSYKVHPQKGQQNIPVKLTADYIAFQALTVDSKTPVNIHIRDRDILKMLVHFGRCLPIMFVYTTSAFGDLIRKALHLSQGDIPFFNPVSKDEKIQKITFLIETMHEEQRNFLRHAFPGDKKTHEVDQKVANEILVRSTPNQIVTKIYSSTEGSPMENQSALNTPLQTYPTRVPIQQPVIKLLTYPPPPLTGGIAITTEDLFCLNEGEFLNDAIIDFYLKYVFYEKLSPVHREKTHIFSSFFYPRLTHKPERIRPGEDTGRTMQARRHNQVKTWTRHVDIFSKDYIIIPVNQNVHWFLAIICYPGHVPEAPADSPSPKSNDKISKIIENVTSTDEESKVIIKEINSNGDDDSPNPDENSMTGSLHSNYEVEEPPDSDDQSSEAPDSSTHPDGSRRKEMPCICIFDSLSGPNRWRIAAALREYLEIEWKMKKGTKKVFDRNTMTGYVMKCPQQTNYSDCGMYLLQFVESFFENPIPYFSNPMPDLTHWFSETKITKKRSQMKELILDLQKKQQAGTSNARKANLAESGSPSQPTVQQTDNR